MPVRTVRATRYVTPLREGGSLPAIVEADDDGLYVMKFRGAGQGSRALIAELLAGELARALGFRVPEVVKIELDPALGRTEPDDEIRDLIKASAGLNLALDFLPRSVTFDPVPGPAPDAETASAIVWFDALITNVDRTPRNANLLRWHRALWLIDHGAALYVHHAWEGFEEKARTPFPAIRDHVLLPWATKLRQVHESLAPKVTLELLDALIAEIPDEWLSPAPFFASVAENRAAYRTFFDLRLKAADLWLEEADRARAALV
ncbi:MAG: aminotransferase class I and II [Myxococcaceae bacterium]|nr:aminotransferase class I and II [Myxococcaceae bacterium]